MSRIFESLKPHICPWCLKRFDEIRGAEAHMMDMHRRNLPLSADSKMQTFHAEKIKNAVQVLMTVSPEMRTAIIKAILPHTHELSSKEIKQ